MPSSATTERPTIRAVQTGDWQLVRDVYVKMLLDSPDALGVTLAEAQGRSVSEWSVFVERCAKGTDMSAFLAEDNSGVCGFVRGDTSVLALHPIPCWLANYGWRRTSVEGAWDAH